MPGSRARHRTVSGWLAAAFLCVWPAPAPASTQEPLDFLTGMRTAYAGVFDYTMEITKEELLRELDAGGRLAHRLRTELAEVRFRKRMNQGSAVYRRDIYFDTGCRLLCPVVYRDGENRGRIRVPWVPDPYPRDPLAMRDQHHPITSLDLGSTIELVLDNVGRALDAGAATLSYDGTRAVGGRPAHLITVTLASGESAYTAQADDDLWSVVDATGQAMYVIMHANHGVDFEDTLAAGTQLVIPDYYGGRLQIWIDDVLGLPVRLDVYDWHDELYERYLYANLRVNVALTDDDFR